MPSRNKEEALRAAIAGLSGLARPDTGAAYVLAYSGGLDSSVLLHALTHSGLPLRAVHINHGMHPDAGVWQAHCERVCAQYGVPLACRTVAVDQASGEGPEAAARRARYAALSQALAPGDVLVLAQHAEDQAQTFLQQALRGAGPRGLAAMPATAAFGPGRLARPLLHTERAAIHAYASAQGLTWVDDPSNHDATLERGYLNEHLWPGLQQHWPHANQSLARSAAWCAELSALADEWGAQDSAACAGALAESLSISALQGLSAARRGNALRCWLRAQGLPAPGFRHLAQIEQCLLRAAEDAQPCVRWPGAELRRHRDQLLAMPPLPPTPEAFEQAWDGHKPLQLPPGCGLLQAQPAGSPGMALGHGRFRVRLRRGGERIRLPGQARASSLKRVLQRAGMPPWVRERLPLIYADDELVAVADIWRAAGRAPAQGAPGWRLRWRHAPPGAALVGRDGAQDA